MASTRICVASREFEIEDIFQRHLSTEVSFNQKDLFYVLRKINSDVAKKTTMELDSVVVRIVRLLFLREADGY
jgi:hypothetical protein